MKLPCSHCGKICLLDDFHEIEYSAEGFFAFCSKECKEKWNTLDRNPLITPNFVSFQPEESK